MNIMVPIHGCAVANELKIEWIYVTKGLKGVQQKSVAFFQSRIDQRPSSAVLLLRFRSGGWT
jgi:hypothetical protein